MFEKRFTLTSAPETKSRSAIGLLRDVNRAIPPPGMYNDGLLAVLDESTSRNLLGAWRWLVGPDCTALMTTGFGDVYYWDETKGTIYFLNVQYAVTDFVDRSIAWVLDHFFAIPDIREAVFRANLFEDLVKRQRPLIYHECFILTPWQMLGGDEAVDEFEIGKCSVYLELVGQARANLASE